MVCDGQFMSLITNSSLGSFIKWRILHSDSQTETHLYIIFRMINQEIRLIRLIGLWNDLKVPLLWIF